MSTAPSPSLSCHVVIPCAGFGARAQTALPKQYQPLAGIPMVMHTLRAFAALPQVRGVLLVTSAGDTRMPALLRELNDPRFVCADIGGDTRARSVLAGLGHWLHEGVAASEWVLVHDAARCLVTPAQISQLLTECANDPVGGLLALPLADTLKIAQGQHVVQTARRDDKWLAQTPQMFRLGALRDALVQALASDEAGITDEASAMERLGAQPRLVAASAANFKVTYPEDFQLAEAVLNARGRSTN